MVAVCFLSQLILTQNHYQKRFAGISESHVKHELKKQNAICRKFIHINWLLVCTILTLSINSASWSLLCCSELAICRSTLANIKHGFQTLTEKRLSFIFIQTQTIEVPKLVRQVRGTWYIKNWDWRETYRWSEQLNIATIKWRLNKYQNHIWGTWNTEKIQPQIPLLKLAKVNCFSLCLICPTKTEEFYKALHHFCMESQF